MNGAPAIPRLFWSVPSRLAWFTLAWWILAEGELADWTIALGAVILATIASRWLWPPGVWHWNLTGALAFIPYFLSESIRGGLDVARRAFDPRLPLDPGIVQYHLIRLKGPSAVFFVWVVSLLPGTAGVLLEENNLHLHVLDRGQPVQEKLSALETRVHRVFNP